jgi:F-type H+-transporting ATPase subunit b
MMNLVTSFSQQITSLVTSVGPTVMATGGVPEGLLPSLPVMIAAAVSLFILTIVVSYFAYFPVKNFLADRKSYVDGNISESEKLNTDAKKNLEAANKKLSTSKDEGKNIVEEYTKTASLKKDEIIGRAKKDADNIIVSAQEQMKIEELKMKENVAEEAIKLSILAAEKLIDKNLDTANNKKLIDDFIKGLDS